MQRTTNIGVKVDTTNPHIFIRNVVALKNKIKKIKGNAFISKVPN